MFRALFLLGCVLPTLAVAGYTARRLAPGYQQALLAGVSQRLGLAIGCDRLETPRPGVYELHGVRLGNGGGCDWIRLARVDGGWRFEAEELRLSDPREAMTWLNGLTSQGVMSEGRIASVTLDDTTRVERVRFAVTKDGVRIASKAGLAAELAGDTTRVETGGLAVPLTWLPATPIASDWAEAATFTGVITLEAGVGSAKGRYDLRGLELDGLSAERGSLAEARVSWLGERLSQLEGRLVLQNGLLSHRLIHGLAWKLEMEVSDALRANWKGLKRARFTDASFAVTLNNEGVRIETEGPAFADGITPLLAPPARVLPVSQLVSAWHGDQAAEIPSSRAAVDMASRLPAPLAPR